MDAYCRLCGGKKTRMKYVLSKKELVEDINCYLQIQVSYRSSGEYDTGSQQGLNLILFFVFLFFFQIFAEDFLPHQICEGCENQMKRIVKYARESEKVQREFHKMLLSEGAKVMITLSLLLS